MRRHTRSRALQRLKNRRLPHPLAARGTSSPSLALGERGPSLWNAAPATALPGIPRTPRCKALEAGAGGTRSGGRQKGEGRGYRDQRMRSTARSPTVGTSMPSSPAAAASPEPAATERGRELRPQVAPRPASFFLWPPLAGG